MELNTRGIVGIINCYYDVPYNTLLYRCLLCGSWTTSRTDCPGVSLNIRGWCRDVKRSVQCIAAGRYYWENLRRGTG